MGNGIFHQPTGRIYNPADMGMSEMPPPARMNVNLRSITRPVTEVKSMSHMIEEANRSRQECETRMRDQAERNLKAYGERLEQERKAKENGETGGRLTRLRIKTITHTTFGIPQNSDDEPVTNSRILFPPTRSIKLGTAGYRPLVDSASSSSDDDTPPYSGDTRGKWEKVQDALNCYITTACIQAGGLSYDCLELRMLRGFKHGFMSHDTERRREVEEYHRIAPRIVVAVNARSDSRRIWRATYAKIQKAVKLILNKDYEGARQHYKNMTQGLLNLVA